MGSVIGSIGRFDRECSEKETTMMTLEGRVSLLTVLGVESEVKHLLSSHRFWVSSSALCQRSTKRGIYRR